MRREGEVGGARSPARRRRMRLEYEPRPAAHYRHSVRESLAVLPAPRELSRVSVPASVLESMRAIGAQLQAGQFRAAHDRLEAIVAANPTFAEAQRLLAGAKLALGDPAAAEALLRRALAVDPGWTPTLTTLGELLLASGRALLHERQAGSGARHPARRGADRARPTGRS